MTQLRAPRAVLGAALATVLAVPSTASATTLVGPARLAPTGPAASSLAKQRVLLTASAPTVTAKTPSGSTFVMPAGATTFGTTTRVRLGGGLVLRRKAAGRTRVARIADLQLRLGKTRALTAKIGGRRVDLFTLDLRKSEYTADAATTVVRIEGARASLTRAAARRLAPRLGLRTVRSGTFGVFAISASAPSSAGAGEAGGSGVAPGGAGSGAGGTSGGTGGSGTGTGTGGSTGGGAVAATPLARPAGAVDVTSSALRWRMRESFVRYVGSGEGVTASDGATPGAPESGVVYDYDFTPSPGSWHDPATGTARLLFTGRVVFRYSGHGIDIRMSDPQIELNGTSSRLLVTFTSANASGFSGLAEFATLNLAGASTTGSSGPLFVRSGLIPRVVPAANEAVMSGFYPEPDNEFGALRVQYTTAP